MKSMIATLALVVLVAVPASLSAQDAHPAAEYRASLMQSLRHHTGALRALVGGDVSYGGHALAHASAVDGIAAMLSDAFPEGTGGEGSRAKPEIWQDATGFDAQRSGFQAAAAALARAAQGDDMDGIGAALREVSSGCRGCHDDYRAPAS